MCCYTSKGEGGRRLIEATIQRRGSENSDDELLNWTMFVQIVGQHLEVFEGIDPAVVLEALQDGDHFFLVSVLAIYHVAVEAFIL